MSDPVDLSIKKQLISKQACFSKLTDDETETLAELLIEKHYTTGELIVKQGGFVDCVFLVVSGTGDVQVSHIEDNAIKYKSVTTLESGQAIRLSETGLYSL